MYVWRRVSSEPVKINGKKIWGEYILTNFRSEYFSDRNPELEFFGSYEFLNRFFKREIGMYQFSNKKGLFESLEEEVKKISDSVKIFLENINKDSE